MRRGSRLVWLALGLWATGIFVTSCFFIERRVFINFVQRFIPAGVPRQLWVSLWGGFGIFVVKGYHVSEYALLTYLLAMALSHKIARPHRALLSSAALAVLFAAADEWHQTFVPGRGGTWFDVVIDACGVGLATLWLWRRAQQQVPDDGEAR